MQRIVHSIVAAFGLLLLGGCMTRTVYVDRVAYMPAPQPQAPYYAYAQQPAPPPVYYAPPTYYASSTYFGFGVGSFYPGYGYARRPAFVGAPRGGYFGGGYGYHGGYRYAPRSPVMAAPHIGYFHGSSGFRGGYSHGGFGHGGGHRR